MYTFLRVHNRATVEVHTTPTVLLYTFDFIQRHMEVFSEGHVERSLFFCTWWQ